MKKISAILISLCLLFSLCACSSSTAQTATDYSNQTLTGKITEIDNTTLTITLGELTETDPIEMPDENEALGNGQGNMPEGEAPGQNSDVPEKPNGQQDPNGQAPDQSGDVPEKPEGEAPDSNGQAPDQNSDVPEKPDGETADGGPQGGMGMGQKGNMKEFTEGTESAAIDIADAVITYNGETITADDLAEGDVVTIVVGEDNKVTSVTKENTGMGKDKPDGDSKGQGNVEQGTSANTISEDKNVSGETFTSSGDDENALRIDGAAVTLDNITVNKDGGSSSSNESGDSYGMNAALLVMNGATVTIKNSNVTSDAKNGNGIFSYGEGTTVNVYDTTITTNASNSGAIMTTGGGTTNAYNLTATTNGDSAAAIRSDKGGGIVNVDGGTYTSNGLNSPAVYSTADINVDNATLTANNSEALVIEGDNSIVLTDCEVSGNMSEKGTCADENMHTIMIYQSMSGDADVGKSSLSITGGTLTGNSGDMIYVTNTDCLINLSNVVISNLDKDGLLLNVAGNSASKGWGKAGSNGGNAECTLDSETIEGDICVDDISTLVIALSNNTNYSGCMNIVDNDEGGTTIENNIVVSIDESSTWNLTGNCTISLLDNKGTINFNGYTITLADGSVLSE